MSSMNPITSFWRSLMMSQLEGLDEKMEDRVAVNSIYAQRTVERFFITPDARIAKPDTTYFGHPMSAAAHSDVKGNPGGVRSSYEGALQYAAEAKERRDELLAKYAANEEK